MHRVMKRGRDSKKEKNDGKRKSVKNHSENRLIQDLDDTTNKSPADVGREMANKLNEEKEDLLIRIVEVLGVDLSTEIYKETQKIEAEGGLMISNEIRRRTSGGVFFSVLKNHSRVKEEHLTIIFKEERQLTNRKRRNLEAARREQKIAEFKERITKYESLTLLDNREDKRSVENQDENHSNPSSLQVADQENIKDYKNSEIFINEATSDACASNSTSSTLKDVDTSYDDLKYLDGFYNFFRL